MDKICRIAITGPESSGKTTLTRALAKHYHTVRVAEYARQYLTGLKRAYNKADLWEIARGQLRLEAKMQARARRFLFCDTDLTVIRIWSEVRFGNCEERILKLLNDTPYDLTFLTDVNIPWQFDPLREHPDERTALFARYRAELERRKCLYHIVRGTPTERLDTAIAIIDTHASALLDGST